MKRLKSVKRDFKLASQPLSMYPRYSGPLTQVPLWAGGYWKPFPFTVNRLYNALYITTKFFITSVWYAQNGSIVQMCLLHNSKCSLMSKFYSILSHNLGRSSGHHRWIRNNPFPSWPVFSCPSWADKVHSCPLFDSVFPPLPLSASFSFSFHCALYDRLC